jgi:hypothetical protein
MEFELFDADNHYYEAEDAFLRHADEKVKKYVRWVSEGKRRYLLFGDRLPSAIPNPTFNPVVRPGTHHDHLKALEAGGGPTSEMGGTRPEGNMSMMAGMSHPRPRAHLSRLQGPRGAAHDHGPAGGRAKLLVSDARPELRDHGERRP